MTAVPPLAIAIACSGLGHVRRGYETFTRALFEHLRAGGQGSVTLFTGAGPPAPDERPLSCVRRTAGIGRAVAAIFSHRKAYDLEAKTFARSLWRVLRAEPFDVIYVPDIQVARSLLSYRGPRSARHPFTVVLHNGAPFGPKKLGALDLVQQLTAPNLAEADAAGLTNTRLLPLPIDTDRFRPGDSADARRALDLPPDATVVLCAAAHEEFKRIDLLIEAVAALPAPRPMLLVLGHDGPRTPALRALAAARLGEGCRFRTVAPGDMPAAHRVADVFVLPSRKEGFGLVLVEAMASGVPVITQDDDVRRWVVGEAGVLVACEREGALTAALAALLARPDERARLAAAGRARAVDQFSWTKLLPRYLALFEEARWRAPAPAP